MDIDLLVEATKLGIIDASKTCIRWSKWWTPGEVDVENLLTVKISEAIMMSLGKPRALTLETPISSILESLEYLKLKNDGKVDITLWNRNKNKNDEIGEVIALIEVKRIWCEVKCMDDLKRLTKLIQISEDTTGSLKFVALAVYMEDHKSKKTLKARYDAIEKSCQLSALKKYSPKVARITPEYYPKRKLFYGGVVIKLTP
jgi:hypothetical protein